MIGKLNLKAARINRNLTATEVAKELGVSQQVMTHYENGVTKMPDNIFEAWCKLLNYEPKDIDKEA